MTALDRPTPWRVRRAVAADAARLALVGAGTFLQSYAAMMDGADLVAHCTDRHGASFYAARLADPNCAIWLGESEQGVPIGYAMLGPPDLPAELAGDGDLELHRIYVLGLWHGTGLGAELLRQLAETAGERGASRLLLGVHRGNDRALGFYRRQGFVEAGTRSFTVGTTCYCDLVLAKPLTTSPARGAGAGANLAALTY
jgi:diamine N-acetyltransferase